MKTVNDILAGKGREVISIAPSDSVMHAIEKLTANKIGALLVLDGSEVAGIITERDVLRIVSGHQDRLHEAPVAEFMSRDVVCAVPEDDLDYVMGVMTEKRFRRMPVMEDGGLVGIVSIGDLVKATASHREHEIRLLRDYISGAYA